MKRSFWENFKNPKRWFLAIWYVLTAVSIGGALGILFTDYLGTPWEFVAYALFACAALTLAYTVFTVVKVVPKWKREIQERLHAHPLTGKLMKNYGFRTVIFSACSLCITVLYGLYNGVIAIIYLSVWYGALAAYYLLLVGMRGGIVAYHGKVRKKERSEVREIRAYRNCGIWLMVTILALSVAIAQMVAFGASFEKPGLMIYVAATYTFTKMAMAIVNFVKARKQSDYTVEAIRNINFADALVSILALQTAMFAQFGEGIATGLANALTGAGVCLLVLLLGGYMVFKGNTQLKKIEEKKTEDVGEEEI